MMYAQFRTVKKLPQSLLACLLSAAALWPARAQDSTKVLTLEQAISTALQSNKNIKIATLDKNVAEANYKQTNAMFLPQANISYTGMITNNPLNAFGFKLQQQSIAQSDFDPRLLNNPDRTTNFLTKVEVLQPLFNMDMYMMRKGASKQVEIYQHGIQRTQEHISYEVTKAYWQLQTAYKAVAVLEEALQTMQAMNKLTNDYLAQGLVQKSDVLNTQVHISTTESMLSEARNNIKNASDYLSVLMGSPTNYVYTVASAAPVAAPAATTLPNNRADFLAMSKAAEASEMMTKSMKMSFVPRLNAFGQYTFNDKEALGFGSDAYMLGVQLSWNVFDGTKTSHAIKAQKLSTEKLGKQLEAQKAENQMLLDKTLRDIENARFTAQQYQSAINQATEALTLLQNRYKQGLAKTTDVLMAQSQLSQQKLMYEQSQMNINILMAYLQFLTASSSN